MSETKPFGEIMHREPYNLKDLDLEDKILCFIMLIPLAVIITMVFLIPVSVVVYNCFNYSIQDNGYISLSIVVIVYVTLIIYFWRKDD